MCDNQSRATESECQNEFPTEDFQEQIEKDFGDAEAGSNQEEYQGESRINSYLNALRVSAEIEKQMDYLGETDSERKWNFMNGVFKTASSPEKLYTIILRFVISAALLSFTGWQIYWLIELLLRIQREPASGTIELVKILQVLVPTVFAEIVAMVFFIVRFVFKSDMDRALKLMERIAKTETESIRSEDNTAD